MDNNTLTTEQLHAEYQACCDVLLVQVHEALHRPQKGKNANLPSKRRARAERIKEEVYGALLGHLEMALANTTDARCRTLLAHQIVSLKAWIPALSESIKAATGLIAHGSNKRAKPSGRPTKNSPSLVSPPTIFAFNLCADLVSGTFHFELVAVSGELEGRSYLTTSPARSMEVARDVLAKVRRHAPYDSNYGRRRIRAGWTFELRESPDSPIAFGELYQSLPGLEQGIDHVKLNAPVALVIEG